MSGWNAFWDGIAAQAKYNNISLEEEAAKYGLEVPTAAGIEKEIERNIPSIVKEQASPQMQADVSDQPFDLFGWRSPYNPDDVGIVSVNKNIPRYNAEIEKQEGFSQASLWEIFKNALFYSIPGIGPGLAAQKVAGGEYSYLFKTADRKLEPRFNDTPLIDNAITNADEIDKQEGEDNSKYFWFDYAAMVDYIRNQKPVTPGPDPKDVVIDTAADVKKELLNEFDPFGLIPGSGGKKDGEKDDPFAAIIGYVTDHPMMFGVGGLVLLLLLIK